MSSPIILQLKLAIKRHQYRHAVSERRRTLLVQQAAVLKRRAACHKGLLIYQRAVEVRDEQEAELVRLIKALDLSGGWVNKVKLLGSGELKPVQQGIQSYVEAVKAERAASGQLLMGLVQERLEKGNE